MVAIPAGFTVQDYLSLEQDNRVRHEYRHGLVYAIAGGSDDHDELCLNLIELLRQQVRSQGCAVRSGNVKVSYANAFFYYPDAFVTCDPRDQADRYVKRYPKLVAEVLSPSTANFDRGEKFADYKQIESLEEYVVISQDQMRVECWRRSLGAWPSPSPDAIEAGWKSQVYGPGEAVVLESVGLVVAIERLYQGVNIVGDAL